MISLWGMGVVFVVLIVLSVAIMGLGRLDRRSESHAQAAEGLSAATVVASADETVSPEIVAVIGAALALAQADERGTASSAPSASSPTGESRSAPGWLASGLARQMATRTRPSIRRSR